MLDPTQSHVLRGDKWRMEDLASILPECPHLIFWQVHHIKGDVPRAVLIPPFTFQTHIISGSFPSSLGGRNRVQEGRKAKGQIPPQPFPLGCRDKGRQLCTILPLNSPRTRRESPGFLLAHLFSTPKQHSPSPLPEAPGTAGQTRDRGTECRLTGPCN